MSSAIQSDDGPWWKYGHVWLVVSGPLAVVLASFFTFYLAYAGMDAVVTEADFRPGAHPVQAQGAQAPSLAPALMARNHAATGVQNTPKP
jgi:hypothetical protein